MAIEYLPSTQLEFVEYMDTPDASASFPPLPPPAMAATPLAPTPVPTRENSALDPMHPWRMGPLNYATAPTTSTSTRSELLSPTVANAALSSAPEVHEVEPRPNKRARVEPLPRLPTFLHPSSQPLRHASASQTMAKPYRPSPVTPFATRSAEWPFAPTLSSSPRLPSLANVFGGEDNLSPSQTQPANVAGDSPRMEPPSAPVRSEDDYRATLFWGTRPNLLPALSAPVRLPPPDFVVPDARPPQSRRATPAPMAPPPNAHWHPAVAPERAAPLQDRPMDAPGPVPPLIHPDPIPQPPERERLIPTSSPPGGFPKVHFNDPGALTKGLAQTKIDLIREADDGTIALVQVYGTEATKPSNIGQTAELLREALQVAFKEERVIVVAPEAPWNSHPAAGEEPLTWTLLRLSLPTVTRLTNQCVWSFPTITFFAYERVQPFPSFLLTLGTFIKNDDNNIIASIQKKFAGQHVMDAMRSLLAANPGMTAEKMNTDIAAILDSLEVHLVQPPSKGLVANIYCASPTVHPDHWRAWVTYLRALPFPCKLNPTGTARKPVRCAGCHGQDHPTLLCAQPGTPGWNGPPLGGRPQLPGITSHSLPFNIPSEVRSNLDMNGRGRGMRRGRGRGNARR